MNEAIPKEAVKLQKEGIPLHKAISMAGMGKSKPMTYSKPMKKSNPGY